MNSRKPVQLEFTDCTHCRKRIATTAKRCHHCQATFTTLQRPRTNNDIRSTRDESDSEDEQDSHMSLAYGGYDQDDQDNQDDRDDQAKESTVLKKTIWKYIAWTLIFIFVATAFLPFLF